MKGILVVGHGSRLPEVNEKFKELIEILRKSTGRDIRGANLTLATPKIEGVVSEMYEAGFREITVIPYFLSNGAHVVKHIPEIITKMEAQLKGLNFLIESSLLLDSYVIKAIEEKINRN